MLTNLKVPNVDPNGKDYRNILACIPMTENAAQDTSGLTYTGAIQSPQYMTIGQPILDTIVIELYDDHDLPIGMYADWFIELAVLFEAPEETDVYRGITPISGQSVSFHGNRTAEGYYQFQTNADAARRSVEAMEVDRRTTQGQFM